MEIVIGFRKKLDRVFNDFWGACGVDESWKPHEVLDRLQDHMVEENCYIVAPILEAPPLPEVDDSDGKLMYHCLDCGKLMSEIGEHSSDHTIIKIMISEPKK